MRQIIEDRLIDYRVLNIEDDMPILEYLKQVNKYRFRLQQVSEEEFKMLKETDKLISFRKRNWVAGYAPLKGNNFRASGGLKVSDPTEKIRGSFVIEDKRIIYDAGEVFFKERDSYVYTSGSVYYTMMSMREILVEELKIKRDYLIYMGEKLEGLNFVSQFENVSGEELLQYATDPKKGELVRSRRRYY